MKRPTLVDKDGEVREVKFQDFKEFRPIVEVNPDLANAIIALRKKGDRPPRETSARTSLSDGT